MFEPNQTCEYIVPRKKRNCRMMVKPGKRFCGEHDHLNEKSPDDCGEDCGNDRIPCPNDPRHTCDKKRLEKHLQVCPARPKERPVYSVSGYNQPPMEAEDSMGEAWTLNSVSDENLLKIIEQVEFLFHRDIKGRILEKYETHWTLEDEMREKASFLGPSVLKHLRQNSSLIGHLKKAGFLKDPSIYVEFGSGRGQLTYWLTQSVNYDHKYENEFILVDRESHRHKFDNRLKENEKLSIERLKVDIMDLNLDKCEKIEKNAQNKPVIAVSKHLCGAATDLALRSLRNSGNIIIGGILIAFCCHHRCDWRLFAGREEYLVKNGLNGQAFGLLCALTSWATCGSGLPRGRKQNKDKVVTGNVEDPEAVKKHDNRYERLNLPRTRREEIGRKVGRVLDYSRLKFVQEKLNLNNSKLVYYCDREETSLENCALLATP